MPTRAVAALSALVLSLLVCGCASLPSVVERPVSTSIAAPADAPLPALARELAIPPGQSALRSIPMPHHALAARLELIARAQSSLDLQTYHIADDATGRLLLRALRDAAKRGVRVRLLVDDFHTEGLDELLLGLAAHPGAEVRLFNPFAYGRDASPVRLWQFLTDFGRLNHRMHNKLFVADGVFAIAGGRNLVDDYFLRSARSNFIDFDLLAAGALVPELSRSFDAYWNSERVYPLQAVAGNRLNAAQRRARFEQRTAGDTRGSVPGLSEVAAGNALRPRPDPSNEGLFGFFIAPAGAFADAPVKLRNDSYEPGADSVTGRLIRLLATEAKSEVILVSPYFVPGRVGMAHLRQLRARGVDVRIFTNATGVSDEPLVGAGYEPYRLEMLRLGVRVFEVTSGRLKRDAGLRSVLGSSTGRLHAKLGFVDRKILLAGSLNLDGRSALINTELGLLVRSPGLVAQLLDFYRVDTNVGVYEVRLKPDGQSLEWIGLDPEGEPERLDEEPESTWLLRLKLRLISLFVPEEQL
ncbi:Phosphatidylserine/phosphatidylglycerophosphate/cardiolipin synthase [Variovorax sp. CF079]|nr:Phosphatidylserine/phosphatidylglycerophosphate/cardiolipin synthase [Variovorax sp. CF079]